LAVFFLGRDLVRLFLFLFLTISLFAIILQTAFLKI